MILSDRFAFSHMPKTAGSFVTAALIELDNGRSWGPGHGPVTDVTVTYRRLTKGHTSFAISRDPWSWYASWYTHCRRHNNKDLDVYGYGDVSFAAVVRGALHPTPENTPRSLGVLFHPKWRKGRPELAELQRGPGGLYTYCVRYFMPGLDVLVDFRQLTRGLADLGLDVTGRPPSNTHLQGGTVGWLPPTNLRELYDDAPGLWDEVGRVEGRTAAMLGYETGWVASRHGASFLNPVPESLGFPAPPEG